MIDILNDFKLPLIILFVIVAIKYYVNGAYCNINKNMKGKNIIITGCNAGIGKQTALRLAKQGAHIICACRSKERAQSLINEITLFYGSEQVHFEKLDLNDLDQIKQFSEQIYKKYNKIDILINNAGVLCLLDPERKLTKQGFESQWGVNYLGHFYLTHLLLDLLKQSGEGKIINVSSDYHLPIKASKKSGIINWEDLNWETYYNGFSAYSQSKLGNIMHARELSERAQKKNINIKAFSLHPGCVDTTISKNVGNGNPLLKIVYKIFKPIFSKIVLKDVKYGAQTSIYLALEDYDKLKSGGYYEECKLSKSSDVSYDQQQIEKLWVYTHNVLKIAPQI